LATFAALKEKFSNSVDIGRESLGVSAAFYFVNSGENILVLSGFETAGIIGGWIYLFSS
jgi:hypothetical protein